MGNVSQLFVSEAYESSIPLFSTLEITHTCNLRCKHCFNLDRSDPGEPRLKEMMKREVGLKAIRQLSCAGALYISLSGGEALVHPNVMEFIRSIRDNKSVPRLKTNGLLLKANINELVDAGLKEIDLTIYGGDEQTYLNFCGTAGLSKAIEGLEACLKNGIHATFNIALHKYNYHQLKEMIELSESFEIAPNINLEMTKRHDGTSLSEELGISSEQFRELVNGEFSEIFKVNKESDQGVQCSCARSVCGIGINGEVYPCIGAPIKAGSLVDNDFETIWSEAKIFNDIRNLSIKDFKDCHTCEVRTSCDRSSGAAYINTGNYTGLDPQACDFANIRAEFKS